MKGLSHIFKKRSSGQSGSNSVTPTAHHRHLETVGMAETSEGVLPVFDKGQVLRYLQEVYKDPLRAEAEYRNAWLANRDIIVVSFHQKPGEQQEVESLYHQELEKIRETEKSLTADE